MCLCVPVHMCISVCYSVAVIVGSRSKSCCVVALGCGSHEGWREGWEEEEVGEGDSRTLALGLPRCLTEE